MTDNGGLGPPRIGERAVVQFRNAVVAVMILSIAACSTLQPIEDFSPSRIRQQVEPGDEVHIVVLAGAAYDLTVERVDADSLTGRASSGKRYKIQFEAIRHIEVAEMDAVKTVGGTLATAYIVVSAIILYAVIAFFESIDDE
jgi:hypothetical protein